MVGGPVPVPLVNDGIAAGCRADPGASNESLAATLIRGTRWSTLGPISQASLLKGCPLEIISREEVKVGYVKSGTGRPLGPTQVPYKKAQDSFSPWPVDSGMKALVGRTRAHKWILIEVVEEGPHTKDFRLESIC